MNNITLEESSPERLERIHKYYSMLLQQSTVKNSHVGIMHWSSLLSEVEIEIAKRSKSPENV